MLARRDASAVAKNYIAGLDLQYSIGLGKPYGANFSERNIVNEYAVPVQVNDGESIIKFNLYVSAKTGRLRKSSKLTPKQIEAALVGAKQHYVLLQVDNFDAANKLLESRLSDPSVREVSIFDSGILRTFEKAASASLSESLKYKVHDMMPIKTAVNMDEKKRRKILENIPDYSFY